MFNSFRPYRVDHCVTFISDVVVSRGGEEQGPHCAATVQNDLKYIFTCFRNKCSMSFISEASFDNSDFNIFSKFLY